MATFQIGRSPDVLVQAQPMGSACCIWRDGLRSYVLSAAHVLGGLAEGSGVQWIDTAGTLGLGQTIDPSLYFMEGNGGPLDAGLASVSVAGPFSTSFGYPWASRIMSWDAIDSVRSVIICGKFGQVFATFEEKVPPGPATMVDGRSNGRLLRLRYDDVSTIGGDSGAPVISLPEGMLMGMHIAREANRLFSLAVAAVDIQEAFRARLPGFELRP